MKKRAKIGLALILVAIGGALAFVGASPETYRSVTDLAHEPAAYAGRSVDLKGTVANGSLNKSMETTPLAFLVQDDRSTLRVEWDPAVPVPQHEDGGTIEGRTVVVTGTLTERADGTWVLVAHDMQVGCASKYEPA